MTEQILSYRIGPHGITVADASAHRLMRGMGQYAPFEEPLPEGEEPLVQLLIVPAGEEVKKEEEKAVETIDFDWDDAQCRILRLEGERHLITITPRQSPLTYRLRCSNHFGTGRMEVPAEAGEAEARFVANNFLMMLYAFASAPHGTLLMHASVVAYQGKGYLFLGKSGTGKSTHSRLWLNHIEGCYLLNDDNPLLHIDPLQEEVTVYGSPWSGKTPCYRNERMPLGALVRLEQAPENSIERLKSVHALASVMPSCSNLKPDPQVLGGVMGSLNRLIRRVPVYRLRCLPDEEAARLCHMTIAHDRYNSNNIDP